MCDRVVLKLTKSDSYQSPSLSLQYQGPGRTFFNKLVRYVHICAY